MNQTYDYDPIQKKLTVRNASHFPTEIYQFADDVEILDISFGQLTTLPEDIARFKKVRIAFFANQDFEEIPPVLVNLESLEMVGFKSCKINKIPQNALPKALRGLILTDNRLSELPDSIGEYVNLQKLMLAGNKFESLPKELLACKNLELLRLPLNSLHSSPDWLFQLPKLSWFTDSGNPFHGNERHHIQGLKEIAWDELIIEEKLAENLKNIVYKARLNSGEEVAVKIFGKGITTDGDPLDEMNACLLAGDHPNIIGGMANLTNIPDGAQGLVMPFIPKEFKKLGNPPDFYTLTRDVYPDDESFSYDFIVQVLRDIASAMSHCQERGIMHGDLYAHNILTNKTGKSFIGDFGAASLYKPNSPEGEMRERIEVRGFGCLIEELLSLCVRANNLDSQSKLTQLKQSCLDLNCSKRPSFIEIEQFLS